MLKITLFYAHLWTIFHCFGLVCISEYVVVIKGLHSKDLPQVLFRIPIGHNKHGHLKLTEWNVPIPIFVIYVKESFGNFRYFTLIFCGIYFFYKFCEIFLFNASFGMFLNKVVKVRAQRVSIFHLSILIEGVIDVAPNS